MQNPIYPCLWFDGNAKEAAEFYCAVFKDSKITVDTPMVVNFNIFGKKFMGLNGGPMFKINPSISMFVLFDTIDETNAAWEKLLDGGKALMPIDKYFWSERYGWVQDKYGMTWQVSVVNNAGDSQTITPSMLFTGNKFGKAEEAIKFYTSLFKNSSISGIHLYPAGDANEGKVMFAEFKLNDYNMIAMDGPGEHAYTFNEGLSLVVSCDTQEEIDHYWNKMIADGGNESMCGWLKDKFGVSWQIVPSVIGKLMTDPEKSGRAMQALMKMKKLVIEDLVNA
ncbi:MAG: VOC family protein [Bacteroidetes bacterium]|nr:MAG: VOC family protein [Bacteroidota bacterium]